VRCVPFSEDGRLLASASDDGSVLLWDARTRRAAGAIPGRAPLLACALGGAPGSAQTLYSAGVEGVVRAYDLRAVSGGSGGTNMGLDALSEAMHVFLRPPLGIAQTNETTSGYWHGTDVDLMPFGGGQYGYTRVAPSKDYLFVPKREGTMMLLHRVRLAVVPGDTAKRLRLRQRHHARSKLEAVICFSRAAGGSLQPGRLLVARRAGCGWALRPGACQWRCAGGR
jgi:hypothetical protein